VLRLEKTSKQVCDQKVNLLKKLGINLIQKQQDIKTNVLFSIAYYPSILLF
jgi:hypothetical protein